MHSPRDLESEEISYSPTAPGEALSKSTFGTQITANPSHDISQKKLNEYMFKMIRYRHMDFELARFIMIKSILSPKQLYLHTKRSKQIKNQWHRDDPCITTSNIVLLIFCALLINLINPMSYNPIHLIWEWFLTSLTFILLQFLIYGICISAITKFIAEKYLRKDNLSEGMIAYFLCHLSSDIPLFMGNQCELKVDKNCFSYHAKIYVEVSKIDICYFLEIVENVLQRNIEITYFALSS